MNEHRVLPPTPRVRLADYESAGGGRGLEAARKLGPAGVVQEVAAAGLRGRGGAGFPTARKWAAVQERESPLIPATVVVNAAEGEPGSFKDRTILRENPFAVLEGALVTALAVDADRVVVATRHSFVREIELLLRVVGEIRDAGWSDTVALEVFAGPEEYLYGEETGLLEVLDGRPPFPRVMPPYRHGVDEIFEEETRSVAAQAVLATRGGETLAPPALASNVETMAHVAAILAEGPSWFRERGTEESPGTIVCTVSGATTRAGVGEVAMGTPLREIVDTLGGGARPGHGLVAVMSGIANPIVPAAQLDTAASYEAMQAIGSGLGAASFIVFDDDTDFAAVAHGVARFLAVESCGQCTPCKQDGLAIAERLDRIRRSDANDLDLVDLDRHLARVADSARCGLARQQQTVIGDLRSRFEAHLRDHLAGTRPPADAVLVAPIVEIDDGVATLEEHHLEKQPDWTFHEHDSGEFPADRYGHSRPEHYPPRG